MRSGWQLDIVFRRTYNVFFVFSSLEKCVLITIGNLKPFSKCVHKPKQFLGRSEIGY